MVATRKYLNSNLSIVKNAISLCVEKNIINPEDAGYIEYERWLKSGTMPKYQCLSLDVEFTFSEKFSQQFTFFMEHKSFGFVATDSYWKTDDEGNKYAEDGVWIWYGSRAKNLYQASKTCTPEHLAEIFTRLINSFAYSSQVKANFYLDDQREFEE